VAEKTGSSRGETGADEIADCGLRIERQQKGSASSVFKSAFRNLQSALPGPVHLKALASVNFSQRRAAELLQLTCFFRRAPDCVLNSNFSAVYSGWGS
jgi:hypothetical protein